MGGHNDVEIEPRILEADLNIFWVKHQPQPRSPRSTDVETHDDAARREEMPVDAAPHPPHQERGILLLSAGVAKRPARPPLSKRLDDGFEFSARGAQMVFGPAAVGGQPSFNHAGLIQLPQALGQQRTRDPREAALEVVEPVDALEELANNERSPAVAEDLRAPSDRAVLSVRLHGPSMP